MAIAASILEADLDTHPPACADRSGHGVDAAGGVVPNPCLRGLPRAWRREVRPADRQPAHRQRPVRRRTTGSGLQRSEEHTSELQSLMRISYAVFCLKQKIHTRTYN